MPRVILRTVDRQSCWHASRSRSAGRGEMRPPDTAIIFSVSSMMPMKARWRKHGRAHREPISMAKAAIAAFQATTSASRTAGHGIDQPAGIERRQTSASVAVRNAAAMRQGAPAAGANERKRSQERCGTRRRAIETKTSHVIIGIQTDAILKKSEKIATNRSLEILAAMRAA